MEQQEGRGNSGRVGLPGVVGATEALVRTMLEEGMGDYRPGLGSCRLGWPSDFNPREES